MNTVSLSVLIIVISIVLFWLLRSVVLLLLRALLNGPLNNIYLDYLRLSTKLNVDEAFASLSSDRAWSEVVFSKVYEIGSRRVSYTKREQNLKYIREASLPSRKLVDELIKVLPMQYRNQDFQAKLACYICELANKVKANNGNGATKPRATVNKLIIDTLGFAFSVWTVGFGYFIVSLIYVFEQYPPSVLLIITVLFFLIMNIPTVQLMRYGLTKFPTVGAIATIILILLGSSASVRFSNAHEPVPISLNSYKNQNAALSISHPEWITMNNIGCNGIKFSVFHYGQLTTPIEFRLSDGRFSFTDKNCTGIIPRIEPSQPENLAYEFYVSSQDASVYFSGIDKISVIPQYIDVAAKVDFEEKDRESLRLENWFWNGARNISFQFASIVSTSALFLVSYLISKRT